MIKTAAELIAEAQGCIPCVDVETAHRLYGESEGAVILDVREADSAAQSKLTDSVNVSRGLIEMKIHKLSLRPDTLILTHCGGGGRASLAARTLQEMGYTNVHAITAKFEDILEKFG